jgi:hypothetical protein
MYILLYIIHMIVQHMFYINIKFATKYNSTRTKDTREDISITIKAIVKSMILLNLIIQILIRLKEFLKLWIMVNMKACLIVKGIILSV